MVLCTMPDSRLSERSPLLHKISVKSSKTPQLKHVAKKHLKEKSGRSKRTPYVVNYKSVTSLSDIESQSSSENAALYNRYIYYQKLRNQSASRIPDSGQQLVIPDHVIPRHHLFIRSEGGDKQSSFFTIFAIWNTMMGTSLLSMPWALQQSGLALGIGFMLFMGIVCLFTCLLIVKNSTKLSTKGLVDFMDVCEEYLGVPGKTTAFVFGVVGFVGGVVVYWVLMTNFLYNIGTYLHDLAVDHPPVDAGGDHLHGAYCPNRVNIQNRSDAPSHSEDENLFYFIWNQRKTVPFYLLVLLLPLSNIKSPTFFTKFNALGSVSVLYIVMFVGVKAFQWGPHLQFNDVSSPGYTHLADTSFPALTGILGLALYIHNAISSILSTNEKQENNVRDTSIAYVCCLIIYSFVGIVFYVCFPLDKGCIQQVLLDNFLQSDVMTFVAQIGLFFQMATVFPLLMYIIRVQIFGFFFRNTKFGYGSIFIHNCCVISLGVVMAVCYPEVGHIIRYIGSISAMVYIFTLPPVVELLAKYRDGQLRYCHVVFYGFFVVLGIGNFAAQFLVN